MIKILHLTLKKKWFDLIASGEKKEEYRETKGYWENRFIDQKLQGHYDMDYDSRIAWKDYDYVLAKNGYAKNAPCIIWKNEGFKIGKPNPAWCEPEDVDNVVFVLGIGEIIFNSTTFKDNSKKMCNGCPFNCTEESEQIQNYACLPSGYDIINYYQQEGKVWACHENSKIKCKGFLLHAKENGMVIDPKAPLLHDKHVHEYIPCKINNQ
jgi:hypothetical protein